MQGAEAVERQDEAMWTALKTRRSNPLTKCLLAVTVLASAFRGAIGQLTTFADPGFEGLHCNDKLLRSLKKTVEEENPSMVYINVPFSRDNMTTTGYETLKGFAEEQMQSGRTCVIADTRHTERWCGIEPTLCRGDLAFYCNDKAIQDELVEWARCRENGTHAVPTT